MSRTGTRKPATSPALRRWSGSPHRHSTARYAACISTHRRRSMRALTLCRRSRTLTGATTNQKTTETQLADKIITATSLEAPPAWWPDFFPPSFHLDNLRQVLLHVIAETACPAGHLDAARGLIDGHPWLIRT